MQYFASGNTYSVHWSFFKAVNLQSTENTPVIETQASTDFGH